MRAPTVRKYLSAAALLSMLRSGFAPIDDHRPGQPDIALTDALMSAFALFSLTSPSLLAFDTERTEGTVPQVYGIERVPCDTRMRDMLDPVEPEGLRPLFQRVFGALQRGTALEDMVCVAGYSLVALEGTGSFSSNQIPWASCLETHHRHGTMPDRHPMLGAALVHPDRREVLPLMPAPIVKQDGTGKNDCERNAAKRFSTKLRQGYPHLKVIVTEDSLSAHAPHLDVRHAHNLHSIGGKEGAHAAWCESVAAAERAGRVTYYDRHDETTGLRPRVRCGSDVPLNAAHASLRVNFLEGGEWEPDSDKVHHFSWVIDRRVTQGTV